MKLTYVTLPTVPQALFCSLTIFRKTGLAMIVTEKRHSGHYRQKTITPPNHKSFTHDSRVLFFSSSTQSPQTKPVIKINKYNNNTITIKKTNLSWVATRRGKLRRVMTGGRGTCLENKTERAFAEARGVVFVYIGYEVNLFRVATT